MKISVIIPVFNAADVLPDCLDAILEQDGFAVGKDYEVVCVDDGSSDQSLTVLSSYPQIRVVSLPKNMGRIEARRHGAEAALCARLVLIDTRIQASKNLLKACLELDYQPAITGDLGDEKTTTLDRVFFNLRRFYYHPFFPQVDFARQLWIGASNFARAPKGAGCLLIDRELFLSALPQQSDRGVNDDTRVFENIVMQKQVPLLRDTSLKVRYLHRNNLRSVCSWLFERGIRFGEYYLERFLLLKILFVVSLLLIPPGLVTLILMPYVFLTTVLSLVVFYGAVVVALSREQADIKAYFLYLLPLGVIFYLGCGWGVLLRKIRTVF